MMQSWTIFWRVLVNKQRKLLLLLDYIYFMYIWVIFYALHIEGAWANYKYDIIFTILTAPYMSLECE